MYESGAFAAKVWKLELDEVVVASMEDQKQRPEIPHDPTRSIRNSRASLIQYSMVLY